MQLYTYTAISSTKPCKHVGQVKSYKIILIYKLNDIWLENTKRICNTLNEYNIYIGHGDTKLKNIIITKNLEIIIENKLTFKEPIREQMKKFIACYK